MPEISFSASMVSQMFSKVDANNDGRLSNEELKKAHDKLADKDKLSDKEQSLKDLLTFVKTIAVAAEKLDNKPGITKSELKTAAELDGDDSNLTEEDGKRLLSSYAEVLQVEQQRQQQKQANANYMQQYQTMYLGGLPDNMPGYLKELLGNANIATQQSMMGLESFFGQQQQTTPTGMGMGTLTA